MTDPVFVATVAVGGVIFTALPTWALAYASLRRAGVAEKNTGEISKKADEIHTLTNSNLTEMKTNLALANEQIHTLQAAIQKLVENGKHPAVLVVPVVEPKPKGPHVD